MRTRTVVATLIVTGLAGNVAVAECKKAADGAPMATGVGNGAAQATEGKQRLFAERAAFMDGLKNLKACLGDQAKGVTGWAVTDVRYFDADPMVEIDLKALFQAQPRVTVVGSAIPNIANARSGGDARIKTTRSAQMTAQRNAKEALDLVFPSDGPGHETSQSISGTLSGCSTDSIRYWNDAAVSVQLTCGPGVVAGGNPTPAGQPAVQQRNK